MKIKVRHFLEHEEYDVCIDSFLKVKRFFELVDEFWPGLKGMYDIDHDRFLHVDETFYVNQVVEEDCFIVF